MQKKLKFLLLAGALLCAVVLGVVFATHRAGGNRTTAKPATAAAAKDAEDPRVPFSLVTAAEGSLDGSQTLSLTFSLPLDPLKGYDAHVDVFEMRPAKPSVAKEADGDAADSDDEGEQEGERQRTKAGQAVSTAAADVDTKGGKRVSGGWVVGENPRLLQFPHVKPDTRYVVVVHDDIASRSGKVLGAARRYSIRVAAVRPAAYFASNGMVLPARQNGGLPVVTVNVPEVDVEFLRVKPEQLARFLDRVIARAKQSNPPTPAEPADPDAPAGDSGRSQPDLNLHGAVYDSDLNSLQKLADSVYHGRFLTDARKNRRGVTFLPVESIKELAEPGVYVAVMNRPGHFEYNHPTTYFYVTDLGLSLRQFDKSADVFVSSLTDGKAVGGVEVAWLDRRGAALASAVTDADGHAAFAARPAGARVLQARKNGQIAMIPLREPGLDLSEYPVTGEPYRPMRLFAYSGRDLYRPGEHFDVSVLLRDADGKPVPPQPVQATLRRADGRTQFVATWHPDPALPGFYRHTIELPTDAPTGLWSLELRTDPASRTPGGVMPFHVEEFFPERLKMDLASPQAVLGFGERFEVDVNGAYLFGAPAAGNRLLTDVSAEPARNSLPDRFPGFVFGDADAKPLAIEAPQEIRLGKDGKGLVGIDLPTPRTPQTPYTVKATMTLLESGGRPLIRSIRRSVWPAPVLLAVRPLFGEYAPENSQVAFELVRADRDGRLKPAQGLPVRLIRENKDFYWRFNNERGWFFGYNETDELAETANVDVPANGHGKLLLPVKWGSYRLEITDPETHLTLRYRFSAGWSFDGTREDAGQRPDRVGLMLDKAAYANGEDARLTISAPHHGQAIVTVEGDRLLWSKRITIDQDRQVLRIPIAAEWKRHDLYATVTVLRPGNEGERVTPARALGIIPLPLARDSRRLTVSLNAADKVRPETTLPVKIRVPGANGEKAVLTLSAVDVGILNITEYKTPDPWRFFFGQLRYGADLHDVYGRLIEKMAGDRGKLKFGGDTSQRAKPAAPQKVKLIDLYSGPVTLDGNGEATVPVQLPDFNGKLRLMAVVAGADRFGAGEREVTVAAPLIAELNTPRFIAFHDQATLALDLHNLSGASQQLKVLVSGDDGLKIGDGQRTLGLAQLDKTTLRFGLRAGGVPGMHRLRVQVDGQGIHIDRRFPLEVEAPAAPRQFNSYTVLDPGQTATLAADGLAGLYPATVSGHLLVSDRPPIDVKRVVEGLLVYPYGCVEQTVSTTYPYLYLDREAARRFGLDVQPRERRTARIERSLSRLAGMQSRSGGFSLWGGEGYLESWVSAYATAFMQDAREQGFAVPDPMLQKALDYLLRDLQQGDSGLTAVAANAVRQPLRMRNFATNSANHHARTRTPEALAFEGFVLARANRAPMAALRDLYDRRQLLDSPLAKVQLGLALKMMGDAERSAAVLKEALGTTRDTGWWWAWDYGSEIRDIAASYALLQRYHVRLAGADQWLLQLADKLRGSRYLSTQEQMAVFLAARELASGPQQPWKLDLAAAGSSRALDGSGALIVDLEPRQIGTLKLTNHYAGKLYVTQTVSGVPKAEPAPTGNFQTDRTLYEPNGKIIGDRPLKVGETVIVEVDVWPRHDYQTATALVVDRVPAGLEIENLNLVKDSRLEQATFADVDAEEAMRNPNIQHVEFRDDRFAVALRLGRIYWSSDDPVKLFYQARVVTPGDFIMPGIHVEDMYNPNVVDDGKASRLVVVNPGETRGAVKSEADTAAAGQ